MHSCILWTYLISEVRKVCFQECRGFVQNFTLVQVQLSAAETMVASFNDSDSRTLELSSRQLPPVFKPQMDTYAQRVSQLSPLSQDGRQCHVIGTLP